MNDVLTVLVYFFLPFVLVGGALAFVWIMTKMN